MKQYKDTWLNEHETFGSIYWDDIDDCFTICLENTTWPTLYASAMYHVANYRDLRPAVSEEYDEPIRNMYNRDYNGFEGRKLPKTYY
jgi:hypothetical protein